MFSFVKAFLFLAVLMAGDSLLLAQTTPQPAHNETEGSTEKLDQAKAEVEQFKTAWDKARLETTLYEQRSKRAYQKWVKATKAAKAKAQTARDKADIELQLSVEKRKLAFSQWQSAQLREASSEAQIKAVAQDRDTKAIQDKIHQLETKLNPTQTPAVSSQR
jgi:microsomal dipeptidase-like Zn-dependent dipeptidase